MTFEAAQVSKCSLFIPSMTRDLALDSFWQDSDLAGKSLKLVCCGRLSDDLRGVSSRDG
jgi:hypothetical protein